MTTDGIRIVALDDENDPQVREMLVDLAAGDQKRYAHPQETREELAEHVHPAQRFSGQNHVLVARDAQGDALGLCWLVLFDPGTGLEGEVAELYVRPEARRLGIATRLVSAAMEMLRKHGVTFACVWTRGDNPAALSVYRAAGFKPTEQTVLTWLPLP